MKNETKTSLTKYLFPKLSIFSNIEINLNEIFIPLKFRLINFEISVLFWYPNKMMLHLLEFSNTS